MLGVLMDLFCYHIFVQDLPLEAFGVDSAHDPDIDEGLVCWLCCSSWSATQ